VRRDGVGEGAGWPSADLTSTPRVALLQCTTVGRLENIIARNQRPNRPRERLMVSLVFGAIVLLILGLMVFTDLGLPPHPETQAEAPIPAPAPGSDAGQAAPARAAPRAHTGRHLDGVLLRTPAAPAAKPTPR